MNKMASCQKHFQIPSITKQESIKISNLIFQKLGAIFYDHVDAPNLYPIMLHQDGG